MIDEKEVINRVEENAAVPIDEVLRDVRVVFAEDSEATIEIFKSATHRLNWNAMFVSNAVEIIDAVNNILNDNLTLDAVVADIAFLSGPKLTGITAAREIRKALPNVPIVFISAYVTSIIREEVRRVGAEIMQKPFRAEDLFSRLGQLIYWNRLVTSREFTGTERRRNSVNRTGNFRRATDYTLSTPNRIAQTLRDINREIK